jgi:type I restriction enzyme S subunit
VFDKVDIDKGYFVHAVSQKIEEMVSKTHGSTMKHIVKGDFERTVIPFPELTEQQHIAAVLDKANDLIADRKQQLEQLDLMVKSRFVEMFGEPESNPMGWEVNKLGDIATKVTDGVHAKPNYTTEDMPFISVVNINREVINFANCKYVSIADYEKMVKSTNPEKGDILYTKVGATYGIPTYVDTEEKFCLYVSVCLIKPNHSKINSRFLFNQMRMPFIKQQADRRISGIGGSRLASQPD